MRLAGRATKSRRMRTQERLSSGTCSGFSGGPWNEAQRAKVLKQEDILCEATICGPCSGNRELAVKSLGKGTSPAARSKFLVSGGSSWTHAAPGPLALHSHRTAAMVGVFEEGPPDWPQGGKDNKPSDPRWSRRRQSLQHETHPSLNQAASRLLLGKSVSLQAKSEARKFT